MRALISILIVSGFAITACEKSPRAPVEEAPPPVVATTADIVGRWTIHSADYQDAAFNWIKGQVEARDLPVDDQEIERHVAQVADYFRDKPPFYTFESDNSMTLEAGEVSYKGTWAIDGDIITVKPAESDVEQQFRYEPGFLRNIPQTDWGRPISMIRG